MSHPMARDDEATLSPAAADLLEAQATALGATFVAVSDDGVVLVASERLGAMWGIPAEALAARSLHALVQCLDAHEDSGGAILARILAGREASSEGEVILPDGRSVVWRTAAASRGRLWVFEDVTASRQAAAALRDAGHLLRILEAHADGAVLELDTDVHIVGIWATRLEFFEKPDTLLQGSGLPEAIGHGPGTALEGLVRRVFASGHPESFEYALDLRGERRYFVTKAILMSSADGESPRVTLMIRDVSERTRMQTQLLEAERMVSVGLLAAGVAHEINNPLAYVLLNLERIRTGLRSLDAHVPNDAVLDLLEAVQMALQGGRRVQTIVRELSHFSRRGLEVREPVDVHRVLDFAIEMAAPEIRDRARVVRDFQELPAIVANENRLGQVFLNLLLNAAQAIAAGDPDGNEIRVATRTGEGDQAIVEVSDTGMGISPSVLPHIFEPFYTTKAAGTGTGLGLAICQLIATSFGGRLTVETELGHGSVFRLVLPASALEPRR
jgi:signal transduction histidine kinase